MMHALFPIYRAPTIAAMKILLAAGGLAIAVAAVLWWPRGGRPELGDGVTTPPAEAPPDEQGAAASVAVSVPDPRTAALPVSAPDPAAAPSPASGDSRLADWMAAWPTEAPVRNAPAGEPSMHAEVAFRAGWYAGVDPEAERTWMRAINDPNMRPGVRSDLIKNLSDHGYSDNSHPGDVDLPLIKARLELIERLAPHAMDEVNAAAFEESYTDLLALYVRLGGAR